MRRAVVAVFAVVLAMTIVGATALAGAAPHDPGLLAVDGSGHPLGREPVLRFGERVTVTVSGFASSAAVAVRAGGAEREVTASASGVVVWRFVVTRDGPRVITFVGAPGRRGRPAPGTVRALVPRIARFEYRVAVPSSGVQGVTTSRPASSTGPLAGTGIDIGGLLASAAVLVGLGAVGYRLGRSRA